MFHLADAQIFIPQPLFLVIEDVGWWQGADGSEHNEPYRNRFCRRHCLADYQALARLAERLSMRIALGMVMGEWDQTDFLKGVTGATWMGASWNNKINRGPWLDEAAHFLRDNSGLLEIALHGVCHEFWIEGKMQRSEFHDRDGIMRSEEMIRSHLHAFGILLEQNGFREFPRLFIPPALNYCFGKQGRSIHPLLHEAGIRYVTTRFSRVRQYAVPLHPSITWDCGVGILERGIAPVHWDVIASAPVWNNIGPILPLHWGNLLHPEPERNAEIIDAWAQMLRVQAESLNRILVEDIAACWRQSAVFYLGKVTQNEASITIDLKALPTSPCLSGAFFLKIREKRTRHWQCTGARIVSETIAPDGVHILQLQPQKGETAVIISPSCDPA